MAGRAKLMIWLLCAFLCIACIVFCCIKFSDNSGSSVIPQEVPEKITVKGAHADKKEVSPPVKETRLKNANVYSYLPLSAIPLLAQQPEYIFGAAEEWLDNSPCLYHVYQKGDTLIMILELSEECQRHEAGFVCINTINGEQEAVPFGIVLDDIARSSWKYDKKTKLPLKHTFENNSEKFTEIWNYAPDESVKYILKDGNGHIISMKKETAEGDFTLRREHLLYDENGSVKMNISAVFDGPNLIRFTCYDFGNPERNVIIETEYEDGNRIKETVYSSELSIKNIYRADYKDGELSGITVLDSVGNPVEKFIFE